MNSPTIEVLALAGNVTTTAEAQPNAQYKSPPRLQAARTSSHRATTDEDYKLGEPEIQQCDSYQQRVNAERPAILSKKGIKQVMHDLEKLEMKLLAESKEQRLLLRGDTPVKLQHVNIRQDGTLQTSMKPRKRKRTAAE